MHDWPRPAEPRQGETPVVNAIGNLLENRMDTIKDNLHEQVTPKGVMGHETALDGSSWN